MSQALNISCSRSLFLDDIVDITGSGVMRQDGMDSGSTARNHWVVTHHAHATTILINNAFMRNVKIGSEQYRLRSTRNRPPHQAGPLSSIGH